MRPLQLLYNGPLQCSNKPCRPCLAHWIGDGHLQCVPSGPLYNLSTVAPPLVLPMLNYKDMTPNNTVASANVHTACLLQQQDHNTMELH